MKKVKLFVLGAVLSLGLFPLIMTGTNVYAAEEIMQEQTEYQKNIDDYQKIIDIQQKKMASMTSDERINEINRLFNELEGTEISLSNENIFAISKSGVSKRSASGATDLKIVNGGINFWASSPAGIDELANIFGMAALGEGAAGGISGIAGTMAGLAGAATVATGGLAALLTAIGGYLAVRFNSANDILREHQAAGDHQAGVRVTTTETLDITSMGIDAYA